MGGGKNGGISLIFARFETWNIDVIQQKLSTATGRGRSARGGFWRTIKYDYLYIQFEENGAALYQGILRFIDDYNYHRHHQGIDRQIPSKLYLRSAA